MAKGAQSLKDKIVKTNLYFFSGILAFLFITFFSYWFAIENKKTKKDLETIANIKVSQLYEKIWNLDRIAMQLSNDPYIANDLLKNIEITPGNIFEGDPALSTKVIGHLIPFVLHKRTAYRICLYSTSNDFIHSGDIVEPSKTKGYFSDPTFLKVKNSFKGGAFRVILPPRDDPFYQRTLNSTKKQIISLYRKITDYENISYNTVGYIEVQQNLEEFIDMFSDLDSTISYEIKDLKGNRLLAGINDNNISDRFEIELPLDDYGILLKLTKNNQYLIRLSILLGAALLVILVLIVLGIKTTETFVIRKLTQPLDELQQMINTVDIGNLDFAFKIDGELDQVKHLESAFREMLKKLDDSITDKVEARTDELRSHLYALQAQINPHFIHNMMAVISSIAEEYNAEKIEDICSKLSSIIRYTAQYKHSDIALENEITHARNFLELMQIRYEDRITYSIEGDYPEGIKVPKFFLQPLVENCFKHGFNSVAPPWSINIDVEVTDKEWAVTITDNGSGFSNEIQNKVTELHFEADNKRAKDILQNLEIGGMGLRNVFARLYLNYKDSMIFEIENTLPTGAKIKIGGPI